MAASDSPPFPESRRQSSSRTKTLFYLVYGRKFRAFAGCMLTSSNLQVDFRGEEKRSYRGQGRQQVLDMQALLLVTAFLCCLHGGWTWLARGRLRQRSSLLQATASKELVIPPIHRMTGEVALPGSESLSNRVLLLAAVCSGTTGIKNLLDCDDTKFLVAALQQLGVQCSVDWSTGRAVVHGNGGAFCSDARRELYLGNAGTAMRPLAALLCMGSGEFVLDGNARMRERPIADLISALRQMGASIDCSETGCPPVTIRAAGLPGGTVTISGQKSSQFLSALLLAAPFCRESITIQLMDSLISAPYVHMTIGLMRSFGVTVLVHGQQFTVPGGQRYQSPGEVAIEGDASSASYFLAGAAITGGPITVHGCGQQSVQGDTRFAHLLARMGAQIEMRADSITVHRPESVPLRAIEEDCGDIPDAAMTLALVAPFAQGVTRIRNVHTWRLKETERMSALVTELTKLGVRAYEQQDTLCVEGLPPLQRLRDGVCIDTYDDHRMAMCFSLAACGGVSVHLRNPECTSKTFPTFFSTLESVSVR